MSNPLLVQLRKFKHLTQLEFPNTKEKIYRLLYDNSVKYLRISPSSIDILHHTGEVSSGEAVKQLYRKVRAYNRITGQGTQTEKLDSFLRIDEVRFLLNELMLNNSKLESRLYQRLRDHVDYQVSNQSYKPLLLGQLLERNEFVSNYTQTNIGHPDDSENYFNKLREMIQQINEQTEYVKIPSYFDVIRTLVLFVNRYQLSPVVVVKTYQNYCILLAGMETTPDTYFHFFRENSQAPNNEETSLIHLDNSAITTLMEIYNSIR